MNNMTCQTQVRDRSPCSAQIEVNTTDEMTTTENMTSDVQVCESSNYETQQESTLTGSMCGNDQEYTAKNNTTLSSQGFTAVDNTTTGNQITGLCCCERGTPGMAISTSKLTWQVKLFFHKASAIHSVNALDWTFFHHQRSQLLFDGIDYSAILIGTGDIDGITANTQIIDLNIDCASKIDGVFAMFRQQIESLKGERSELAWRLRMEEGRKAAVDEVLTNISNAYESVSELINNLPEHAQETAFNLFRLGQNFVEQAVEVFLLKISATFEQISSFIQGMFQSLEMACDAVKESVELAIECIGGIHAPGGRLPGFGDRNGGSDFVPEEPEVEEPPQLLDVSINLVWLKSHDLLPEAFEASVKYFLSMIGSKLDPKYNCQPGEIVGDEKTTRVKLTIRTVEWEDVSNVMVILRSVADDEGRRILPLPEYRNIPTPNPLSYFVRAESSETKIRKQRPIRTVPQVNRPTGMFGGSKFGMQIGFPAAGQASSKFGYQNGFQTGSSTNAQNGVRFSVQNGSLNGTINGTQNGNQNGTQNGFKLAVQAGRLGGFSTGFMPDTTVCT